MTADFFLTQLHLITRLAHRSSIPLWFLTIPTGGTDLQNPLLITQHAPLVRHNKFAHVSKPRWVAFSQRLIGAFGHD